MLCLTIGIVAGIGWSLVYVTSAIILFRWFDENLALAMGIASAGSGLGAFVFGPFNDVLFRTYGFHGGVVSTMLFYILPKITSLQSLTKNN